MTKAKLYGTIDVECPTGEWVWCRNCDRTGNAKRIFPGGRMNLVWTSESNMYEPWCMECSLPLMQEKAREIMIRIMSDGTQEGKHEL